MLIFGACACCCSERGAFGFSNDRSFTYWARTLSCGGAWLGSTLAGGGPPLVDAMKLSSGAGGRRDGRCGYHTSLGATRTRISSIGATRWLVRETLFGHA